LLDFTGITSDVLNWYAENRMMDSKVAENLQIRDKLETFMAENCKLYPIGGIRNELGYEDSDLCLLSQNCPNSTSWQENIDTLRILEEKLKMEAVDFVEKTELRPGTVPILRITLKDSRQQVRFVKNEYFYRCAVAN
jgi:hypothetical protein